MKLYVLTAKRSASAGITLLLIAVYKSHIIL